MTLKPQALESNDLSVICFLVVNFLPELPLISIESCLANSSEKIVIGYINEEDLVEIPKSDRIVLMKLEVPPSFISASLKIEGHYIDFDQAGFFRLVALKWILLKNLIESGFKHIVYSDLDIVWFENIVSELRETHTLFPNIQIAIQDDTSAPSQPRLCMGIFSLSSKAGTLELLDFFLAEHLARTQNGEHVSDDDIITEYYIAESRPSSICLLSQDRYPTGRHLNSYSRRNVLPGLELPGPAIFHANWVVGLKPKIRLMKIAINEIKPTLRGSIKFGIVKTYLHVRYFFGIRKLRFRLRMESRKGDK